MRKIKQSQEQHKRNFAPVLQEPNAVYFSTVCSVLHVNTTASDFKILFVFFLWESSRKHDRASGNPIQRILSTRPVTMGEDEATLEKKFFAAWKNVLDTT